MHGATLEELRDLSRRSRRTLAWGVVAVGGTLAALPLVFLVADLAPGLAGAAAILAILLGGALLLKFAHVAGQERGAFRKLFRAAKSSALAKTVAGTAPVPEPADLAAPQ